MKKNIEKIIEIPEGIEVSINKGEVSVKSNGKEQKRDFRFSGIKKQDNKIIVFAKNATKRESKIIGSVKAHITNMINGFKEEFTYTLEICNVHFPMNVKVEGEKVVIKSFLGEVKDRIAKILPNTKVEVSGNDVIVSSFNRESAGQTAANIEKATRVGGGRDKRVFQDGIFIKEKPGRKI